MLMRGSFTPDELRILVDALDPCGLSLYLMVQNIRQVRTLQHYSVALTPKSRSVKAWL